MPAASIRFSAADLDGALRAREGPADAAPGEAAPARDAASALLAEAARGAPLLAADAFLARTTPGALAGGVRALGEALASRPACEPAARELLARRFLWEALLELGGSLDGAEPGDLGFAPAEAGQASRALRGILSDREAEEAAALRGARLGARLVRSLLDGMRSVNNGDSLPGLFAEEIAAEIGEAGGPRAFAEAYARRLRGSVYRRMIEARLCKFGNDYARGLSHLRHLGFRQVSTNPVLAAKAFDEDEGLVERFRAEIARRPEWRQDPAAHGDAMAMAGTLLALWPNLCAFRLPAVRADLSDWMVSFQLNPNLADDEAASLEDAEQAFGIARAFLAAFDRRLLPALEAGRGTAPNLVFKVAGSSSAARGITRRLNAKGLGTNNTVVYSVGQEITLILDALEGKAEAARAGRPVVRTYETNMGGRLASHLREAEAERLAAGALARLGEAAFRRGLKALAEALKADPATLSAAERDPPAAAAARVVAFRLLKRLDDPAFAAIAHAGGARPADLASLEQAIRMSGTLVARRVYRTFYAPENRPRWIAWLSKRRGIPEGEAGRILDSMDCLPASKRIPEDTLLTLAYPNQCNTEFPNHARAVELHARRPGFRLEDHAGSLLRTDLADEAAALEAAPDFVRAYEVTPEMKRLLAGEVGIAEAASFGERGLAVADWPSFGPVAKTLAEFKGAYDGFVRRLRAIAAEAR